MHSSISLTDSEVAAVTSTSAGVHIRLSAAHVLCANPAHAGNAQEGFSRGVELLLSEARLAGTTDHFLGRLSSGRVLWGNQWSSRIPLPCATSGPVKLELTFANQSHLELTANGLECRFEGEPNFSESLSC